MTPFVGVYSGKFDPLTLGHLDIIQRGAELFDRLVVAVTADASHSTMFTVEERVLTLKRETKSIGRVEVASFDSLLVNFAAEVGASTVLRGIRGVTDFEYEYQLTGMNRQLNDRVETVFLMADVSLQPISSRLVKEIAGYGGPIGNFVTSAVEAEVLLKLGRRSR